jgi:hypothetical protein
MYNVGDSVHSRSLRVLYAMRANNPDLVGAQEVGGYSWTVAANLGPDYQVTRSPLRRRRMRHRH